MTNGLTGSFELVGTNNMTGRISWSEKYDVETNKHVVEITNFELKSSNYYGFTYYLNGSISVAGSSVVNFNSFTGTHNIRPAIQININNKP